MEIIIKDYKNEEEACKVFDILTDSGYILTKYSKNKDGWKFHFETKESMKCKLKEMEDGSKLTESAIRDYINLLKEIKEIYDSIPSINSEIKDVLKQEFQNNMKDRLEKDKKNLVIY